MKIRCCFVSDTVRDRIESSGMRKGDIAECLDLKPSTLSYRLSGRCAWKHEELVKLSELLHFDLEDAIKI